MRFIFESRVTLDEGESKELVPYAKKETGLALNDKKEVEEYYGSLAERTYRLQHKVFKGSYLSSIKLVYDLIMSEDVEEIGKIIEDLKLTRYMDGGNSGRNFMSPYKQSESHIMSKADVIENTELLEIYIHIVNLIKSGKSIDEIYRILIGKIGVNFTKSKNTWTIDDPNGKYTETDSSMAYLTDDEPNEEKPQEDVTKKPKGKSTKDIISYLKNYFTNKEFNAARDVIVKRIKKQKDSGSKKYSEMTDTEIEEEIQKGIVRELKRMLYKKDPKALKKLDEREYERLKNRDFKKK